MSSSYDYDYEEYELENGVNQSSSSTSLGNTVLAFLKKPIEWITQKPSIGGASLYKRDLPNVSKNVNKRLSSVVSNNAHASYHSSIGEASNPSHPLVNDVQSDALLETGETGDKLHIQDKLSRPYYSNSAHILSSKAKLA